MAKNDCQGEARHVFEKLALFREESNQQFYDIINSHSNSINKGINDLVAEVFDLQGELSVIKGAQNGLLEIIDNLNGEIRQLNAKLTMAKSLQENIDHQTQGAEDIPIEDEQDLDRPGIHVEGDFEEINLVIDDSFHTSLEEQNTFLSSDHNNFRKSPILYRQLRKVNGKQIKPMRAHLNITEDEADRSVDKEIGRREMNEGNFVCPECSLSFSANESLRIHGENIHSNLVIQKRVSEESKKKSHYSETKGSVSDSRIAQNSSGSGGEKLKCHQCPYETSERSNLRRHIKAVHDKIRNHVCNDCGFSANQKANLMRHIELVHMKIKHQVCRECGYVAHHKSRLKEHMKKVHEKIPKLVS